MNMDWDSIRLFVTIADAGSLTQAARLTGLSQPTVSRKLKSLEDSLGGALFERLPSRLILTRLGEETIELGRAMEAAAGDFQRKAQLAAQELRQPIRISATMSVSLFLVEHGEELALAAAQHGGEIHIEPSRAPLNLAFRQADLAIRLRQIPDGGLVRVRKIETISFSMYAAAHRQPHDAEPRSVIGLTGNRPPPQPGWVDGYARSKGLPVTMRLGEFFLRHEAARMALGAALLPCFIGDRDASLRRLCEPPAELDEDVFLMAHREMVSLPPVKAVADRIAGIFKQNAALLTGSSQLTQPPE